MSALDFTAAFGLAFGGNWPRGGRRGCSIAAAGERPDEVCTPPPVDRVVEPDEELAGRLAVRLERWRALYGALRPEMRRFDRP